MKKKEYLTVIFGMILLLCGFFLLKGVGNLNEFLICLPYVCIGLGCGIFGHGMGNMIANKAVSKNSEVQKQIEIEKNDERNIAISSLAKSKAFDIMTFVFGALMVSFALMGVEIAPILLLVFVYLFVEGSAIFYRLKYDKEM